MTKEEFTKQFNELTTAQTIDHAALASFRQAVEADYDDLSTTHTTLTNTQETINNLNTDINKLKDANMRLFMMNPSAQKDEPSTPPPDDKPPVDTDATLTSVIDALVGKKEH